ncbi:MAG: hypothetical protein ACE5HC_16090 [Candidatus Binatia bacterium]
MAVTKIRPLCLLVLRRCDSIAPSGPDKRGSAMRLEVTGMWKKFEFYLECYWPMILGELALLMKEGRDAFDEVYLVYR